MGIIASNIRRSNGSKRNKVLRYHRSNREPCHLCGYPIHYEAHYMHPHAMVVDELVPVSLGGDPFSLENTAPAHRCCNGWRGNKQLNAKLRADIRARYERTYMKPKRIEHNVDCKCSKDW